MLDALFAAQRKPQEDVVLRTGDRRFARVFGDGRRRGILRGARDRRCFPRFENKVYSKPATKALNVSAWPCRTMPSNFHNQAS